MEINLATPLPVRGVGPKELVGIVLNSVYEQISRSVFKANPGVLVRNIT